MREGYLETFHKTKKNMLNKTVIKQLMDPDNKPNNTYFSGTKYLDQVRKLRKIINPTKPV